jgi:hypothetical protein
MQLSLIHCQSQVLNPSRNLGRVLGQYLVQIKILNHCQVPSLDTVPSQVNQVG